MNPAPALTRTKPDLENWITLSMSRCALVVLITVKRCYYITIRFSSYMAASMIRRFETNENCKFDIFIGSALNCKLNHELAA